MAITHIPAELGTGNLRTNPDLPGLLGLYGSASSTPWVEPQYKIFREYPENQVQEAQEGEQQVPGKGAAIGYLVQDGRAIAWGEPLCPVNYFPTVVSKFLEEVQKQGLKPIWSCITEELEKVLSSEPFNWQSISCIKEDIIDPTTENIAKLDKRVRNKINKATKAGVHIHEDSFKVPEGKFKEQVNAGIDAWESAKKGAQISVSGVEPWRDATHRRFFWATAKLEGKTEEEVVGMLVLAKVKDAWVLKWLLEFPNAPKGTSEDLVEFVLELLHKEDSHHLTFGISRAELKPKSNISAWKIVPLSKTFEAVSNVFHLGSKSEFRTKFNAQGRRVYIAYPKNVMGKKSIGAIVNALKSRADDFELEHDDESEEPSD